MILRACELQAFQKLCQLEREREEEEQKRQEEERRKKREATKRMQRMLEAAFDGDVPGIKEILSEVSSLANTNLVTWPPSLSILPTKTQFLLRANFAVVRPQKAANTCR